MSRRRFHEEDTDPSLVLLEIALGLAFGKESTGGRALNGRGARGVTKIYQTPNTRKIPQGVRLSGISFLVERERAQPIS